MDIIDMTWALEFGYVAHEKGKSLIEAIEDMNRVCGLKKKREGNDGI